MERTARRLQKLGAQVALTGRRASSQPLDRVGRLIDSVTSTEGPMFRFFRNACEERSGELEWDEEAWDAAVEARLSDPDHLSEAMPVEHAFDDEGCGPVRTWRYVPHLKRCPGRERRWSRRWCYRRPSD
jgi:hypothetical protein